MEKVSTSLVVDPSQYIVWKIANTPFPISWDQTFSLELPKSNYTLVSSTPGIFLHVPRYSMETNGSKETWIFFPVPGRDFLSIVHELMIEESFSWKENANKVLKNSLESQIGLKSSTFQHRPALLFSSAIDWREDYHLFQEKYHLEILYYHLCMVCRPCAHWTGLGVHIQSNQRRYKQRHLNL